MVNLVVCLIIAILLITIIATSKYHQPVAGLISGSVFVLYGSWLFFKKAELAIKRTANIWEIESIKLSGFCWPILIVLLGISCIIISVIVFSLQKISNLERDEMEKTTNEDKSDC